MEAEKTGDIDKALEYYKAINRIRPIPNLTGA